MKTINFLRLTMLWILLIPPGLRCLGEAANYAVLIANHDKFPVLVNDRGAQDAEKDGMFDQMHCLMTPQTHLNALADIWDTGEAQYSIGDALQYLGEYLQKFLVYVWLGLFFGKFNLSLKGGS